jgi:hypothetical protein
VMVDASTPLKENAEIAFFPPVTGGWYVEINPNSGKRFWY